YLPRSSNGVWDGRTLDEEFEKLSLHEEFHEVNRLDQQVFKQQLQELEKQHLVEDLRAHQTLVGTSSKDDVITIVIVVSLRGTSLVEAILVKGHLFLTIMNILPVGFGPLALVVDFTPVKFKKGLLESFVLRESICLGKLKM
nr:hypothetical protein [Tanacetum cinerariifolium]